MGKGLAELWPLDRRGTHAFLAFSAVFALFIFVIGLEAVFTPFFISLTLAYILNPFVNFGQRFAVPRWGSTIIIFIFITLLILLFVFLLVPSFYQEFKTLSTKNEYFQAGPEKMISKFKGLAQEHLSPEHQEIVAKAIQNWYKTLNDSGSLFKDTAVVMGQKALDEAKRLPGLFLTMVLIPFYLFFLLTSLNKIWRFVETYAIPYEYRSQLIKILEQIHVSLSAFFRGRLLICVLIGFITWIGLWLMDVPFPFIFGFAIGFATLIPLSGLFVLIPASILYMISGANFYAVLYLIIFYSIVQGLEMFVFTPFILGKKVELPPIVLVLSLLCFGHLFGVIGVLLAVPIASTAKILFSEFIFPSFVELSKDRTNSTGYLSISKDKS